MIRMGGDITYKNNEAINWAAGFERLEMVKYLLKKGANIDLDKSIRLAKQNKHIETSIDNNKKCYGPKLLHTLEV